MEISFTTTKLGKRCNSLKEAEQAFGKKIAYKLILRLGDLEAVECLEDLYKLPHLRTVLRCHLLSPKNLGKYAVGITERWRIIFKPAHNPIPLNSDGGFDQKRITKIEIISVEDYHG